MLSLKQAPSVKVGVLGAYSNKYGTCMNSWVSFGILVWLNHNKNCSMWRDLQKLRTLYSQARSQPVFSGKPGFLFCLSCTCIFWNERNWMKKSARVSEKLVSPGLPGLQVATRLTVYLFALLFMSSDGWHCEGAILSLTHSLGHSLTPLLVRFITAG